MNNLIVQNCKANQGGGIEIDNCNLTLSGDNTLIAFNEAENGGGLYSDGSGNVITALAAVLSAAAKLAKGISHSNSAAA